MSETPTINIPLGFQAPEFHLPDTVSGQNLSYQQIKGEKGTVVIFICNHCPFVIHVIHEIVNIAKEYMPKGIGFVAISSNDVGHYPQDAPDKMKDQAGFWKFPFAYLYDETQDVAKAYQAACTPDFNVFDAEGNCAYRGQMDEARPNNDVSVDGKDLRKTLDSILKGEAVSINQKASTGCNIKWKEGYSPLQKVF